MAMARIICMGLLAVVLAGCVRAHDTTVTQPANPPAPAHKPPPPTERVRMTTTLGEIVLELDRERAPVSVANFLDYTDKGEYNGTIFHRVIENFVIQGGGYSADFTERTSSGTIKNEWQNGLKNVRGTIAMARETEPDSATREFYINVQDNPRLDTARDLTGGAGYAVFGHVVEGMDVVDRIRKLAVTTRPDPSGDPKKAMENAPVEPPMVLKVERVR